MLDKKIVQHTKQRLTCHRQGDHSNIFIFTSARSGSTWLAELIGTQPGFKMVKEPFNIRQQVVRDHLGINEWEGLFLPENKPLVRSYIQNYIDGKNRDWRLRTTRFLSKQWKFFTDRIVFKILFAGEDDINWFGDQFNGHTIFLIRHPIPVSLSREVCPRLNSFLQAPYSQNFTDEQLRYAHQIIQKGDDFEVAILDWCLQNVVPLKQARDNWLTISYEQMVLEPETIISSLVEKFSLEAPEKMNKSLYKASGSTVKSNSESQEVLRDSQKIRENRKWLVEKWKSKVAPEQEKTAQEIMDIFEVDCYVAAETRPCSKYWISSKQPEITE